MFRHLSCLALLLSVGCYGLPDPALNRAAEVERARSTRARLDARSPLSGEMRVEPWVWRVPGLAGLHGRLLSVHPEIRRRRARFEAARRVERAGARWDDPVLSGAATVTVETDPAYGGAAGIGFSIPIGGRLSRKRALLSQRSREANAELEQAIWEATVDFRDALMYHRLAIEAERTAMESHEWARKGTALAKRLVLAGSASAVDVLLLETEERAARLAWLEARHSATVARESLADLLLLDPDAIQIPPLPSDGPTGAPEPDRLFALYLDHAPALRVLEAQYESARHLVSLEKARSIPDIGVGFEAEGEPGGGTAFSLPLEIPFPLWNANEAGIAGARAEMEVAAEEFRATLGEEIAAIHSGLNRWRRIGEQIAVLQDEAIPEHARALVQARKAMEVSDFDAARYVELERAQRDLTRHLFDLHQAARENASGIERLVGFPVFPLHLKEPSKEDK